MGSSDAKINQSSLDVESSSISKLDNAGKEGFFGEESVLIGLKSVRWVEFESASAGLSFVYIQYLVAIPLSYSRSSLGSWRLSAA